MSIDFPVSIRFRGERPFPARARNVSVDGMYLETRSLILPRAACIDLEFLFHGRTWEIRALIVHSNWQGLGVVFVEPQHELAEQAAKTARGWPRTPSTRHKPAWPPRVEVPG